MDAELGDWLVWRRRNGVGHINKVKLRRARLARGLAGIRPGHSGSLSLAIFLWVRAMAMVSATAEEETTSSAWQWDMLLRLMAYRLIVR